MQLRSVHTGNRDRCAMNLTEAKNVCRAWFDHNEAQRAKSVKMQQLAALARTDPKEARRQMAQIDRQPTLYDGARLEPAVRFLLKHIEATAEPQSAAEGER